MTCITSSFCKHLPYIENGIEEVEKTGTKRKDTHVQSEKTREEIIRM